MTRIGGSIDLDALEALAGTPDPDRLRMQHFRILTHEQQCEAVRRMADGGSSDAEIAHATGWSREYVAHVIGERGRR